MFKFTIRELVLVTVIVALGVAWWRVRLDSAPLVKEHNAWLSKELENSYRRYADSQRLLQEARKALDASESLHAAHARAMKRLSALRDYATREPHSGGGFGPERIMKIQRQRSGVEPD
jgi:hypothetical protein